MLNLRKINCHCNSTQQLQPQVPATVVTIIGTTIPKTSGSLFGLTCLTNLLAPVAAACKTPDEVIHIV